jgi:hypothetical protein
VFSSVEKAINLLHSHKKQAKYTECERDYISVNLYSKTIKQKQYVTQWE